MQTVDLSGSYTAIAAIVVAIIAHFGFSVQVTDVVTVITGLVALYGIIRQMVVHTNTVAQANARLAGMQRPQ